MRCSINIMPQAINRREQEPLTERNQNFLSIIATALDSKKAQDLKVLEISDITIVTDYFVLATGTSSTHVRALADEVDYQMSKQGIEPHHIEGKTTGWVLLDYGSVVVHVFTAQAREFYNLDRLWNDGKEIAADTLLKGDEQTNATL